MALLPSSILGLGGWLYLMGSSGQWYLLGLSIVIIKLSDSSEQYMRLKKMVSYKASPSLFSFFDWYQPNQ